jgi:alpha-glucosidase
LRTTSLTTMWWHDAVIYQVYLRSFQDSDGDGVGDIPGVISRLEHIAGLGADAVWLSPVYPSPNADFGYDVSDFQDVEPAFGTMADLDRLIGRAHDLGLKVLLDFVPCHTSTEHPWFREHPEYYVWSDNVPNNWRAAFGGGAWGFDEPTGRYFLHSFFPEQADLNWHRAEVRAQMAGALAFWRERGIDGFRLDALDRLMKDEQLRDDPPATGPPPLPMDPEDARLEHTHSRNAPGIDVALSAIRQAVDGAFLVGEVYLPTSEMGPYLESLDVVFSFEALHTAGDPSRLREAIAGGLALGHSGWVLSNHDFSRLATRAGPGNARASALLLLSLPGPVFMFQGDELGMPDALTAGELQDRNGRDPFRVPMLWDESEHSGFSTAVPWLQSAAEQDAPSVNAQDADPESMLSLTRRAIAMRREMSGAAELLESAPPTIVIGRDDHVIAVNLGDEPRAAPALSGAQLTLEARPGDGRNLSVIPSHGGWVARTESV